MTIYAKSGTTIHIGRVGENLATEVVFDISKWIEEYAEYGQGFASLVIQQNGETYPQFTTLEGTNIIWTVTNSNTASAGMGKCELFYSIDTGKLVQLRSKPEDWEENWKGYTDANGDYLTTKQAPSWNWEDNDPNIPYYRKQYVVVKSAIYDIIVTNALGAAEDEVPAPYQSWFDDIIEKATFMKDNIQKIEESTKIAVEQAKLAQSWTEGGTNSREGEDENNALYWSETAKNWAIGETNSSKYFAEYADKVVTEQAKKAEESANKAVQYSGKPPMPKDGNWYIWNATTQEYEDSGVKSALSIKKSYISIEEMESDFINMQKDDLVIISSNIDDENNSKLFIHNGEQWQFLSDLSGLRGTSIVSIEQTAGNHADGTFDTYTITLSNNETFEFKIYNGADGDGAGDMIANIYDPQGKRTDIFKYIDDAVAENSTTSVDEAIALHNLDPDAHPNLSKVTLKTWTLSDLV